MKQLLIALIFVFLLSNWIGQSVFAQVGGKSNLGFLALPQSALVTGVGGVNVSIFSEDPTLQLSNPALLNESMDRRLALTHSPWFAYSNYGSSYAHHLSESKITLGGTILYNNYGRFDGADAGGNPTGTFTASDVALVFGGAQAKGNFRLGGNLKYAASTIANFAAHAVAVDLGAAFIHPNRELRVGLVVKNIGFGLANYTSGSPALKLPLDVQAGISYKLQHMPLRFSLTTHSLNTWDVVYLNANPYASNDPSTRVEDEPAKPFFDQLARRVVIGGEFLLGKGFNVRVGYNHQINRELKQELAGGFSGFSAGAMARIKAFEISYTQAFYHVKGSTGMLTIALDMHRLGLIKKAGTEVQPQSNPAAN